MANTVFQLKRSSVAGKQPNTATLSVGELAINLTDKKLYSSDGSNIFEPAANVTNLNVTSNATIGAIIANGSIGSNGQILASNGTGIYWTVQSGGVGAASFSFTVDGFTGNGSVNTYTLSTASSTDDAIVAINGVLQDPTAAYSISGTTLTFTENISNNAVIDVRIPTFTPDAYIGYSNSYTTSNTSQQVADTFETTLYRSASYIAQITDNTGSNYHFQNISLIHDGTNVYMSEFGAVYSNGSSLATFDASISSNTLSLLVTPVVANSTIKVIRTTVTV